KINPTGSVQLFARRPNFPSNVLEPSTRTTSTFDDFNFHREVFNDAVLCRKFLDHLDIPAGQGNQQNQQRRYILMGNEKLTGHPTFLFIELRGRNSRYFDNSCSAR